MHSKMARLFTLFGRRGPCSSMSLRPKMTSLFEQKKQDHKFTTVQLSNYEAQFLNLQVTFKPTSKATVG